VLFAAPSNAVLAGIRAALERDRFDICCSTKDAAETVAAVIERKPDICLIDIDLPGGGIVATARITGLQAQTAVVMLVRSEDDGRLLDALRAGALGYVDERMDGERLGAVLGGVLAGEAALSRVFAARLVEEFRGREQRRLRRSDGAAAIALTPREWDVVELLKDGDSTAEIAGRLGISPVTVRRHVSMILGKLDAPDRAAVVALTDPRD